jgi:hypothetical protein
MATVSINLDIPHLDPTSENVQRVKDLLLYALSDMVTNNGHLINESRDFALAQLVTGKVTCSLSVPDEEVEAALDAAAIELAEDAEVL